jgi:hypothetical protein
MARSAALARHNGAESPQSIRSFVELPIIDSATKYWMDAPSIPAFFVGMGGKECHSFFAGSIGRVTRS